MNKIFIAGCGYIGERVARLFRDAGAAVVCQVRSPEHGERLQGEGFTALVSSYDTPAEPGDDQFAGAIVYYLVPPPGGGIIDSRARNFISALETGGKPARIIYMSATSVYSEAAGGVVTEQSPAEPDSAMGKRRLDAEKAFQEFGARYDIPVLVLRVSGIYGAGRLPLTQISQGQPLLLESEAGPSNRIHADDLAAICVAAAAKGAAGDIFNVSDGNPSSMTEYFNACADALGYPRQPQVGWDEARRVMTPLMFSYVSQSRIVDVTRLREILGVTLRYPVLRDGLAASV